MPPTPEDIISQMDQFLVKLENIATIVAAYHTALMEKGISRELADQMSADLSKSYFSGIGKKE